MKKVETLSEATIHELYYWAKYDKPMDEFHKSVLSSVLHHVTGWIMQKEESDINIEIVKDYDS